MGRDRCRAHEQGVPSGASSATTPPSRSKACTRKQGKDPTTHPSRAISAIFLSGARGRCEQRPKRIRTVHDPFALLYLAIFFFLYCFIRSNSRLLTFGSLFQQRERDTSNFVAFEPAAAAVAEVVERTAGEGAEVDASADAGVPASLPKRRRLDSKISSSEYFSHRFLCYRCFQPLLHFLSFPSFFFVNRCGGV